MSPGSVDRARAGRTGNPTLKLVLAIGFLVLIVGAIVIGFLALYREFWSPSAFAERYVEKVAAADASGALAMPGVAPNFADLQEKGRGSASESLLRSAALRADISDVHAIDERTEDGDTIVTVGYTIDGAQEQMEFQVGRDDEPTGLVPQWQFEVSPLSIIDLTVRGSWRFTVNDMEFDKRQLSPAGLDADPLDPVSLLTFSPGAYDVSVDTAATQSPPQVVRSPGMLEIVPLDIQTTPTDELTEVVQSSVDGFLDDTCTTQSVLQPADCPFGFDVSWGIAQPDIVWSIAEYPRTALVPDGNDWTVSATTGTAHIALTVQCYTGVTIEVDQDVYFTMVADVDVREDGGVHITIDREGDQPPTPNLCA